jgi:hypothetical protein
MALDLTILSFNYLKTQVTATSPMVEDNFISSLRFTKEEVKRVIFDMEDSPPGLDGFSVSFNKYYSNDMYKGIFNQHGY